MSEEQRATDEQEGNPPENPNIQTDESPDEFQEPLSDPPVAPPVDSPDTAPPEDSPDTAPPAVSPDTPPPADSLDSPPPAHSPDTPPPADSLDSPPPAHSSDTPPSADFLDSPPQSSPEKSQKPKQDLTKTIADSLDIIHSIRARRETQKQMLCQMSFILDRVRESLEQYNCHNHKLVSFFDLDENRSEIMLKTYSDFLAECNAYFHSVKDVSDKIRVCGAKAPVAQKVLKKLVFDVGAQLYADGTNVKTHVVNCAEVKGSMDDRILVGVTHKIPFDTLFDLINNEVARGDAFNNRLFEIEAFIGFMKSGDLTVTMPDEASFNFPDTLD